VTRDELRLRATALSHFEVPWLGPGIVEDDGVAELLLEDCERVQGPDGVRHWSLDEGVRRSVVSRRGVDELRAAWRSLEKRPEDAQQWAIDQLLLSDPLPELDEIEPERARALESVSRWLGAAEGARSHRAIRNALRWREFLAPLERAATSHFVGRAALLEQLEQEVGREGPMLVIHGFGGIGKSAVLARHTLHSIERHRALIGYLNFDHSALDASRPATLVQAMAQQLSLQLDGPASEEAERLWRAARDRLRTGERGLEVQSRGLQVRSGEVDDLLEQLSRLQIDEQRLRPYVLVLDTVEEVQRRERSAIRGLAQFVDSIRRTSSAPAQVLLGGRAPVPELGPESIQRHLAGLEQPEAIELLGHLLGDSSGFDVDWVVGQVGTSPLSLRLAAAILRRAPGDDALRDLAVHRAGIEGELYRRLLAYIPNEEVRRLAHPGLTLRQVTPDLIRHVLARPCGVPVPDDDRANELFEGLAREAMLVERAPDDYWKVIHRPDVRGMMLERLAKDEPEAVPRIHRAAVRFYDGSDDLGDRTEAMYHRLMLGQKAPTLDRSWRADLLAGLVGSLDELPPSSKAYLAAKAPNLGISDEDLREADVETGRKLVQKRVGGLIADGLPADALVELERHLDETEDKSPLLRDLQIQALELLGRLPDAVELADAGRDEAGRLGATDDVVTFTLHAARLRERLKEAPEAELLLKQAYELLRSFKPTQEHRLMQLRLGAARLGVARRSGESIADDVANEALELFEGLPRRAVGRVPGLLRDLAAELGGRSTEIVAAALQSVGIGATAVQASTEGAFTELKKQIVGEEPEQAEATSDETFEWASKTDFEWASKTERGELGRSVSSLLPEEETAPSTIRNVVAEIYASESDSAITSVTERQSIPRPVFRNLRVFAVDPGLTTRFDTAVVNEATVRIPWEEVEPGPAGEYVAIRDEDDEGNVLFEPVDLNRPELLAHDGLEPSDGNPQFRQQMLYAVAMKTIHNFERALGRPAHWPPEPRAADGRRRRSEATTKYRRRLVLHPHAFAEMNAFFQPDDGALHFGYFESGESSPFPGVAVFTCLSQDVIAHELTHALMLGMNINFEIVSNPDASAFHDAFADLIALFQHFEPSDVLREQIAAIKGDLQKPSQLGAVGLQVGQASGRPDGLRNALGHTQNGRWQPRRPDPQLYRNETESHARGDILVGAVFEAFRKIYDSRVADLRSIATKGTGVLAEGQLHPDLVERFTREAAESARHVLEMCIRALDYLPPVDITFGDFLRAVVTADYDLFPIDDGRYRLAFLDAFRSYGILPAGLATLSIDTLLWPQPDAAAEPSPVAEFVRELSRRHTYWNLPRDREALWHVLEEWRRDLAAHLKRAGDTWKYLGPVDLTKPFEVLSLQLRERTGLPGDFSLQWVVKVMQKPSGALDEEGYHPSPAGCTLLLDAETGRVRYEIAKEASADRGKVVGPSASLLERAGVVRTTPPEERGLRVFAFDPTLGVELETAGINEVTLRVPWERTAEGRDLLRPGPVGEYLEVIDRDPASRSFYAPVDLDDPSILAQSGLPPSESNPQFHQQMVYTVAMRTIRNFEHALGRLALWSPHRTQERGKWEEEYVQRLRIHPHALREANAYYSPSKKALLFGYFPASSVDGAHAAPLTVFTCLSHDIIAHEVTHALLDGIHRRFNEASNPDVLAFHEAFADIVALFQRFSLPAVLRHQIAATRGDLASQNRLGELAQQFGQAIGKRGALRSAIGGIDPKTGKWAPLEPDLTAYARVLDPHNRGALLVAAVFDAFLTIYKARVADLLRIASEGTGVLPAGHLHPYLVDRLADEAATSAQRVLEMCIRALDYCPPVDITFGDYLRALVTADFEHDPIDDQHERVAFVEAFRRRGIVPRDVRTLSVDGLLWRPTADAPDEDENVVLELITDWAVEIGSWGLSRSREELFHMMRRKRAALHAFLHGKLARDSAVLSGIDPALVYEVHSIRPSVRTDWNGQSRFQWVVELTQRIPQGGNGGRPDYYFRGGCTLLVDAEVGKVRYSIKKPLDDEERMELQRRYLQDDANESLAATYLGDGMIEGVEPFAMLHRF
jgi:AAA ATPase-like protein